MTQHETSQPRGRGALIALWTVQVLLAALFLIAGGLKLGGAAVMVTLYDTIGWGQWFRYATGIIEVSAAIALLIPSAAPYGAILIIPTMLGAIVASVTVLHASPALPCVLLLGAAAVAWARRRQLPMF
jgi:uncharacterized membrane protein YphA (DoxX/SURF4 family)